MTSAIAVKIEVCDRCGEANARAEWKLATDYGPLYFCGHHGNAMIIRTSAESLAKWSATGTL